MPASHKLARCSLPPPIDTWGQSLNPCCTAQEARRIETRAASTPTSSSNAPSPNKMPMKKQGHPAMVQHSNFLLIFLLCSKLWGTNIPMSSSCRSGHQCFSNSGCLCSGMNSYVWATFPQQQFIPQTWCYLSVTGQGWQMPGMQHGRTIPH